jgi:hypothetical protein
VVTTPVVRIIQAAIAEASIATLGLPIALGGVIRRASNLAS